MSFGTTYAGGPTRLGSPVCCPLCGSRLEEISCGRCFAVGVARRAAVAGGQLSRAFSIPTGATARSRRRPATRWSGRPGRRLRAVPGRARGGAEPVGPG